MAQPRLEVLSIQLSRELGDSVAAIATAGDTYTAEMRIEAINRGRQTVYTKMLTAYQGNHAAFGHDYPELVTESIGITLTTNRGTNPTDMRFPFSVYLRASNPSLNAICHELDLDKYHEGRYNSYSKFYPSATNMKYFPHDTYIEIYGTTITTGVIDVLYLKNITDAVLAGADIIDPLNWFDQIIKESYEIATRMLQEV